jgi:calcium channel MID1
MYSSVRTCPQCLSTYTSWLCSIRMPRCTDYDSNPSSDDSVIRTFPRTVANTSRTPSLPSSAFPYSEVPPCIEVCNIVQASCPPLISSSFWCPLKDITLDKSYATPFTEQIAFQNVQGGDDPAWIQKSLDEDDPIIRSQDRWGNVKCNDMGVINLINRRRYSGLTVVASTGFALPSSQVNYVAISLVVLATGLMCFIPL